MAKSPISFDAPARAGYDAHFPDPAAGGAFDVRELLAVFRRNARLILALCIVSTIGTYVLLSRQRVRHRAEAMIRLRDPQAEMTGGLMPGGESREGAVGRSADPIRSELMVLQGRQVAASVVDREGFRLFDPDGSAPYVRAADVRITLPAAESRRVHLAFGPGGVVATTPAGRATAAYGQPVELDGVRFTIPGNPGVPEQSLYVMPRERAIDWVIAAFGARPVEGTDAILVNAITPSAPLSVRLTNAVVEEYQAVNIARNRERNRLRREFLEARLRETDDSLVEAQTALGHFRSRTGVYGAREQFEAQRSGASDAEWERRQLLAEQRVRRALLSELDRSPQPTQTAAFRTLLASADIAGNPMVSQLYGRLTELETKRDELIAGGRPVEHPDVRQIQTVLDATQGRLLDAIRSQVSSFDTRVAALGQLRDEATAEVSRLTPTEAEEVRLAAQVEAMRAIGAQLRTELQRTRLAEAAEMGQVEIVDRATRGLPLRRGRPMKLALGLALGLFLGVAIALVRSFLDTGLHRRMDVEQLLRVPGLAVIPQLPRERKGRRLLRTRARAGIASATDSAAGAYRALRTRLLFTPHNGTSLRSVVVTSAWAGEGKTTTAANLAVTLAHQGMRVLLVDCDLRRPRLHTMLGLPNVAGLAEVLRGRATLAQVVQPSPIERLCLLSSGKLEAGPIGPSELLGAPGMTGLLGAAARQFEIVILDSPPVLLTSDATILAARTDAALLVLRAGSTSRALAQDAMRELSAVGANVVGAVLNDPDAKTAAYQEYSHQYAY